MAHLRLGNEEEHKGRSDEAAWEPDVPVLRTPVQRAGVDEVRCCEGREPRSDKSHTCGETERVASQLLSWDLAPDHPGEAAHTTIVGNKIDDRESNDDVAGFLDFCKLSGRITRSDNQLTEAADDERGC